MTSGEPVLLWLLGAYFVGILVLGSLFSRKITTLAGFFLADRKLTTLPVAFTFAASWFGAGSMLAGMNEINHKGLSGLWDIALPSVVTCVLITLFLARPVARQTSLSQPETVEKYYGKLGRYLLSFAILMAVTALLGSQLVAAGKIYETTLGLDLITTTFLITSMVVLYGMLGGYLAVVVTDVIQLVFMASGLVILLLFCLSTYPSLSLESVFSAIEIQRPASFWSLDEHLIRNICLMLSFVMGWVIAPEMWQRMSSTQNETMAFRSAALASGFIFTLFGLVAVVGVLSVGVVPESDRVLVDLAFQMNHPFWTALVIAGVTSAIASTMDSSINVGSLTLTRDLYQTLVHPQAGAKELIWISRLGTLVVVLPAVYLALTFQDILHVLWISADIYASTMFVPIIGLLYLKHPGRWSGLLAMVFGGVMVILSALNQYEILQMPSFWPESPYSTLAGVAMSALGFAIGYFGFYKPKVL